MSGKSSEITSVTAQQESSGDLVPSAASVSAHNRLSFSNVGKKYLQSAQSKFYRAKQYKPYYLMVCIYFIER